MKPLGSSGYRAMSALDWITVAGFRSIASIEKLPLRPINVLIGSNGSGKSNFVGVFSFLHAIRNGELRNYVKRAGGADRILHFGAKTTPEARIHISFENEVNQYEIEFSADHSDSLFPFMEQAHFWNKRRYDEPYSISLSGQDGEAGIVNSKQRIAAYVRLHLDRWRLYHFHDTSATSPMKRTGDVDDNRSLRPDGSNLAAFLYYLGEKHPGSYGLIRRTVKLVAPFFDDFRLAPRALNEAKIRLEWRHLGTDAYFDAASLSDGSLRFIALATLLLQPAELRPSVILLDEPELGLHPYAVAMLSELVKQASQE